MWRVAIRAASVFGVAALVGATPALAWISNINGSATRSADEAQVVATDAAGCVVAAGVTVNGTKGSELTVVKLAPFTGTVEWQSRIPGAVQARGVRAQALSIDQNGDVLVAGALSRTASLTDFVVAKFDGSDGHELWRFLGRDSANDDGTARTMALDQKGNAVVAGEIGGKGFTIVKMSGATGDELWRKVVDSPLDTVSEVAMVTADANDDVIAVGQEGSGGFIVIKLSGTDGEEAWRVLPAPSFSNVATHVQVDRLGDVTAAGPNGLIKVKGMNGEEVWRHVRAVIQPRALVIDKNGDVVTTGNPGVTKLSGTTGEELWAMPSCGPDILVSPASLALDESGDIAAAGTSFAGPTLDIAVSVLHGASGIVKWCQVVDGQSAGTDGATAVVTTPTGDVVAVGSLENVGSGSDFTVLKYRGRDGSEEWRQLVNGTVGYGDDVARSVALDLDGNILAAGNSENLGTGSDFTVIKLAKERGSEIWRYTLSGDMVGGPDRGIAALPGGEGTVVAGGMTWRTVSGADLTVVKLSSVDGSEMWRQVLDGGSGGSDVMHGLAIDRAGDVLLAGSLAQSSTLQDFAVIKLSGLNGIEHWRFVLNGTGNSNDAAVTLAATDNGDVVAAGLTYNLESASDVTVVRLAGKTGDVQWHTTLNGDFLNSVDFATALAIDSIGNIVVAGYGNGLGAEGSSSTDGDLLVVKLKGTNGDELWHQAISGKSMPSTDIGNAVTTDASDDILVAGGLEEAAGEGERYAILKLSGESGREKWRYLAGPNSQAVGVATDDRGDVFGTGTTLGLRGRDFTVVKVARSDGQQLWRRDINGTGTSGGVEPDDFGYAVVARPNGDAVASGATFNQS